MDEERMHRLPYETFRLEDGKLVSGQGPWAPVDNVLELVEALHEAQAEIAHLKATRFSGLERNEVE